MKNFRLSVLTIAIAFFSFSNLIASTATNPNKNGDTITAMAEVRTVHNALRTELSAFIQNPDLKGNNIKEGDVFIRFRVNTDNQIEVVKTLSNNTYLETFVANNLNNQTIATNKIQKGEFYNLRIEFVLQ